MVAVRVLPGMRRTPAPRPTLCESNAAIESEELAVSFSSLMDEELNAPRQGCQVTSLKRPRNPVGSRPPAGMEGAVLRRCRSERPWASMAKYRAVHPPYKHRLEVCSRYLLSREGANLIEREAGALQSHGETARLLWVIRSGTSSGMSRVPDSAAGSLRDPDWASAAAESNGRGHESFRRVAEIAT